MNSALTTAEDLAQLRWYVMRAHKCEGKAEQKLSGEDGLEYFIPKRHAIRVYHGVKSRHLVPVIPSLVFVHASRNQITDFKKMYNFLQFVTWKKSTGTEYVVVQDDQMNDFIKVASCYDTDMTYYRPEEINLKKGTRVRIHGGKFDNVSGVFTSVRGKRNRRVIVLLDGILGVEVETHPDLIEVIS